ncbi:MAG TPA: hypothetical protein VNA20_17575, partial [Frankiaceae bacterium]|nr:hypothetical protein [Frankiaceae bacterium]
MSGRTAREARTLGLWTASWLGLFLLVGLLRVGDLSVQWPVLLVPVLWALVARRPRRSERGLREERRNRQDRPAPVRTDTVERSFLQDRPDEWQGRGP